MKNICGLTQQEMDIVASYMNDDIREDVHCELAPCTPAEFIARYLEFDPEFEAILKSEFSLEVQEGNYGYCKTGASRAPVQPI